MLEITMRDRTSCAGSVTPGPERRTYMRHGWRVAGLGAALTAVSLTTGCGPFAQDSAAASASSASAAASAAATAAPGPSGPPADPSLPNPTDVATDPPVSAASSTSAASSAPSTSVASSAPSTSAASSAASSPSASATATARVGTAAVITTYSGWVASPAGVEVGAYVAGVAESGGTCTLTLTSGAGSATAEVPAEPDAASTSCPTLTVPGSKLSSGTWSAVVTYESPSISGK